MSYPYSIYNESGTLLFNCKELLECQDVTRSGNSYLFAMVGLSDENIDLSPSVEEYSLKFSGFDSRLDFDFTINKVIKGDGVIYLDLVVMNSMYEFGALSLLKIINKDDKRIWLDMVRNSKRIYISACYIANGISNKIEKNCIIIEGKYIHDYYSFYCEFGYSFFNTLGYMGSNLDAFEDCLVGIKKHTDNLKVIWKDSSISFKAIDNTIPNEIYKLSSGDIIEILREHCDLILQ